MTCAEVWNRPRKDLEGLVEEIFKDVLLVPSHIFFNPETTYPFKCNIFEVAGLIYIAGLCGENFWDANPPEINNKLQLLGCKARPMHIV